MKIKVSDVYTNFVNLSYEIIEQEKIYYNMYDNMLHISDFWNDEVSIKYLNQLQKEKQQCLESISELKKINGVLQNLIDGYSKLGNSVFFEQKNVEKAKELFEKCISLLDSILKKYNSLDISNNYELDIIYDQIDDLNDIYKLLKNVSEKFTDTASTVLSIEQNIKNKLNKIEVEIVEESDINEFI